MNPELRLKACKGSDRSAALALERLARGANPIQIGTRKIQSNPHIIRSGRRNWGLNEGVGHQFKSGRRLTSADKHGKE